MKVEEELIQYYLPYFISREDVEKALIYDASKLNQKKCLAFIKSAVERHSTCPIQYDQEGTGQINGPKHIIHFAILPTGDLAYYTVNKKSNKKANYSRIMKLESIYNRLIDLGVLDQNIPFGELLVDTIFGVNLNNPLSSEQLPNNEAIPEEIDISYISLNSSIVVNDEFFVIDGGAEIVLNTDFKEENIGYISFKIYNSTILNKFQLLDASDAFSSDEEWEMSTFLELFDEEIEELSPKFLMLNRISIKPTFRNKGYGKEAIKELIQLCKILEVEYIALKPSPIENVDFNNENKTKRKKDIERLVCFYDQLGFDSFCLQDEEPIMVFQVMHAELAV